MERQGEEEMVWVKYVAQLMEQYHQVEFKYSWHDWQNMLPNPSGKAKIAPEMKIELQRKYKDNEM